MRRDPRGQLAVLGQKYTAEPYNSIRARLERWQPLIPRAATPAQERFEAQVFHELLMSARSYTLYPLGVRRVMPRHDTLQLEAEDDRAARRLLRDLLPSRDPDGEIRGIEGTRITRRTRTGIQLEHVGRAATLWLTGPEPSTWLHFEAELVEQLNDYGTQPLWTDTRRWTRHERAWDQRWNTGPHERRMAAGAWCASGLLRRLALFHTVSTADLVSGYPGLPVAGYDGYGPARWVLSLDHRSGIPHRRTELEAALTHPHHGLALATATHLDTHHKAPQHVTRLDDRQRTALVELRYDTFDYSPTHRPDDQRVLDKVRHRVDRTLARTAWAPSSSIRSQSPDKQKPTQ